MEAHLERAIFLPATSFAFETYAYSLFIRLSYNISDMQDDFLIIVDSMANLDLLYYVGNYTGDQELIDKATSHAKTVIKTLVRPDFTTYHVANLDPNNGNIKDHFTHQGCHDNSSWSRYYRQKLLL